MIKITVMAAVLGVRKSRGHHLRRILVTRHTLAIIILLICIISMIRGGRVLEEVVLEGQVFRDDLKGDLHRQTGEGIVIMEAR